MAQRRINRRMTRNDVMSAASDSELDYSAQSPVTLRVKTFKVRRTHDDISQRSSRFFALYASAADVSAVTSRKPHSSRRTDDNRQVASRHRRSRSFSLDTDDSGDKSVSFVKEQKDHNTGVVAWNKCSAAPSSDATASTPVCRATLNQFLTLRNNSVVRHRAAESCDGSTGIAAHNRSAWPSRRLPARRARSDLVDADKFQGRWSGIDQRYAADTIDYVSENNNKLSASSYATDVMTTGSPVGDVTRTLSTDSGYQSPPAWRDGYSRLTSHDILKISNMDDDHDAKVLRGASDELQAYLTSPTSDVSSLKLCFTLLLSLFQHVLLSNF